MYNNPFMPGMGQSPFTAPPVSAYPRQEVVKVNGENGARAYTLGPNSSAILLDESGTSIWLVVSDGAGYKTVTPYDITPHKMPKQMDLAELEERIKKLEDRINDSGHSNALEPRAVVTAQADD